MEEFKTLNWSHLKEIGINPLTGEACAFSMRLLCDLNADGVALIEDFFGLLPNEAKVTFPDRMNSQVNGEPSVASMMLPRSVFGELMIFALFREGYAYVVQTGGSEEFIGVTQEYHDAAKESWPENWRVRVNWKRLASGQPSVGSRNIHAFSGRVL